MAVSHFLRFVGLGLNVNTCGNRVALRQIKQLMAAFLSKSIFPCSSCECVERAGIGGPNRGAGRLGAGCDRQVVAVDWLSGRFRL